MQSQSPAISPEYFVLGLFVRTWLCTECCEYDNFVKRSCECYQTYNFGAVWHRNELMKFLCQRSTT